MRIRVMLLLLLLLLPSQGWTSQGGNEATLATPAMTAAGVVCTNSFGSALYRVQGMEAVEIASGPGIGRYFSVSPDGGLLGFKEVAPDGSQRAALLDVRTGSTTYLSPPSRQIGQVSFARDGAIGFTWGTRLTVLDGPTSRTYELGTYANLAPLSPDGHCAVFNDENDQLWLMDFRSGLRTRITSDAQGYMCPVWSPDGGRIAYRSLDGEILVHERISKRTWPLGRGGQPAWTADGATLVFSRTVVDHDTLAGADIHAIRFDGTGEVLLTRTDDRMEMDPAVAYDGRSIVYHTFLANEIYVLPVPGDTPSTLGAPRRVAHLPSLAMHAQSPGGLQFVSALDIPYVHQVYDTPDWFNGHSACAPTQAIMVLAYYHVLPSWPITCSWPTPHLTAWGNYVASTYRFRGYIFANTANDPNGVPGMGGFGYMWTGGASPHVRMADYYRAHGMTALQTEATPYSTAASDIASGYPFSMCVLLTSAGHLVVAHGFGAEPHTLVFNDPYGNKNQGYMNRNGKNVMYDWPGYNNGFQNLNEVAWCIGTRFSPPVSGDTLVDDLQFGNGFTLATAPPASMALWKDMTRGHQGHLWYTLTTGGAADTLFAEWRPSLSETGVYQVEAFIELSNATDARYVVSHAGGTDTVTVDQKAHAKTWATLGTWTFNAGAEGAVRLGNRSAVGGQELVFDAVRWVRVAPTDVVGAQELPLAFRLDQNYPNPFNPSTRLTFSLPRPAHVVLEVFSLLGQRVSILQRGDLPAGHHAATWSPASASSGVYFARLHAVTQDGVIHRAAIRMMYNR
ncbi:MAG: PD40 domain-containing protein [Ignavibacteriae bacterium]|nr:PD40 domain-containing protein [Ignavibacteriota bacterium]